MLVVGKKTLIEIPVQDLFPLEVHASNNQNSITKDELCRVKDGVSVTQTYLVEQQQLLQRRKSSLLTTC